MKKGLFIVFAFTCMAVHGQINCALKIGDMKFAQPPGAAEAFVSETGDTTWRIKYIIPESGKQALLNSIFGAMHYQCDDGVSKVKFFNLTVTGEKPEVTLTRYVTKNYILRDEELEKLLNGSRFRIYIDNIYLFMEGSGIQSVAILYGE